MDEVITISKKAKTLKKLMDILFDFSSPTNILPTSCVFIFHQSYVIASQLWGGAACKDRVLDLKENYHTVGLPVGATKKIWGLLSGHLDKEIIFTITDQTLGFSIGHFHGEVDLVESMGIVTPESLLGQIKECPGQEFLAALKSLSFCMSKNTYQPAFCGIWFVKDQNALIASDNYRVTRYTLDEPLKGIDQDFFMSAEVVEQLIRPKYKLERLGVTSEGFVVFDFGVDVNKEEGFLVFVTGVSFLMPAHNHLLDTLNEEIDKAEIKFDFPKELLGTDLSGVALLFKDAMEYSDAEISAKDGILTIIPILLQASSGKNMTITLPLRGCPDFEKVRIHSDFLLTAIERYSRFVIVPGRCIYAYTPGTSEEHYIGWKVGSIR